MLKKLEKKNKTLRKIYIYTTKRVTSFVGLRYAKITTPAFMVFMTIIFASVLYLPSSLI